MATKVKPVANGYKKVASRSDYYEITLYNIYRNGFLIEDEIGVKYDDGRFYIAVPFVGVDGAYYIEINSDRFEFELVELSEDNPYFVIAEDY